MLISFGPVIKTNVMAPPSHTGVDISREERWVNGDSVHVSLCQIHIVCVYLLCYK